MSGSILEKLVAGRWIAGESIEDAIVLSKKFRKKRISTILNYLGEEFKSRKDVDETVDKYLALIRSISKEGVPSAISLKPTKLGLLISTSLAESNYARILRSAYAKKIFVWLDMETSKDVDFTLRIYKKHFHSGNSGVCIQAYLKRSRNDVAKITNWGGVIRLVKGAYNEPQTVAYKKKAEIDSNYLLLLRYLFSNSRKFMVATHDIKMIDAALRLGRNYNGQVTYAMLNGIRNKLAVELAKRNNVAIYVPFGSRWVDYAYRRLREAGHLNIIVKSLLESQKL